MPPGGPVLGTVMNVVLVIGGDGAPGGFVGWTWVVTAGTSPGIRETVGSELGPSVVKPT